MEELNRSLFEWAFQFSHQNFFLDLLIVFVAQYLPYFLVLGVLALIAEEKTWRKRLFFLNEVLLSLLLSRGIITELIRFFYNHARPFDALGIMALIEESGHSFPSGHAAFFFALAITVFYYNRRWGMVLFLLALLNGVARVVAGVHWPLDIVGGIVVGTLSALAVHALLKPSFRKLFQTPEVKERNY